jgi:hypothetical protein
MSAVVSASGRCELPWVCILGAENEHLYNVKKLYEIIVFMGLEPKWADRFRQRWDEKCQIARGDSAKAVWADHVSAARLQRGEGFTAVPEGYPRFRPCLCWRVWAGPSDDGCTPGQTGAKTDQKDAVALFDAAFPIRFIQGQRYRCG